MGKTVPAYRMALEEEINRWSGFARALRKPDREAFDELMDMYRSFAMAGSNATNPILFESMIMSILLFQQKRITLMEEALKAVSLTTDSQITNQEINVLIGSEAKTDSQKTTEGGGQSRLY